MSQRTYQARRRQQRPRSPWAALLIPFLAIVITGGLFYFLASALGGGTVVPTPSPLPPTATPTEAAAPTPTPEPPTATPEPTPITVVESPTPVPGAGVLRVGGQATVNAGGGLRVRSGPGTSFEAVTTLSPGVVVKIIGGPERADTYTWWQIEFAGADDAAGQGWVAGDFLEPTPG